MSFVYKEIKSDFEMIALLDKLEKMRVDDGKESWGGSGWVGSENLALLSEDELRLMAMIGGVIN